MSSTPSLLICFLIVSAAPHAERCIRIGGSQGTLTRPRQPKGPVALVSPSTVTAIVRFAVLQHCGQCRECSKRVLSTDAGVAREETEVRQANLNYRDQATGRVALTYASATEGMPLVNEPPCSLSNNADLPLELPRRLHPGLRVWMEGETWHHRGLPQRARCMGTALHLRFACICTPCPLEVHVRL